MKYLCQDADGRTVEIECLAVDRPPVDVWFEWEGRQLKRLVTAPAMIVKNFRHVAWDLPPGLKGAQHYTGDNIPCFDSKRECDEFEAQNPRYRRRR